jgi:ATPase subunit of ABC transporter with duplicated ATPase domains
LLAGILKLRHCAGYPYAPIPPGYDEGWVKVSKGTTCSYLEQIPQYAENVKVIDVLNSSFEEVHRLEAEMHVLEKSMLNIDGTELKRILARYSKLMQLYEIKGGYDIEEKLSKICKGLKFNESFLEQDFNMLSGGEKTTVVLGKLLIDTPDVLLLDEPTNHLDMDSIEWLQDYIKSYKGTVVVVSHDRYFLDYVTTKIIEVENKECETYIGNYSEYMRQKELNLQIQINNFKEQNKKISHTEQSIKELREWAMKADNNKFFRRAASMQIKLDKIERIEKPILKKQYIKMDIKSDKRSGNLVMKVSGLSKNFGSKVIFKEADLLLRYGERVALIGPNGSGKTTFLKILLGEVVPDDVEISMGSNVMMAYLPQNIVFEDEEQTVLDYFREDISVLEGKAREHLAKFMFCGGNVFKRIKHLSGGERARLKLCKLLFKDINLLILDEPTNHLDIASIESIEAALSNFKGTTLFISHDRFFINRICERVIAIEEHRFVTYLGNYDYYKQQQVLKDAINQQNSSIDFTKRQDKACKSKKAKNDNSNEEEKKASKLTDISEFEDRAKVIEDQIKEIETYMEVAGSSFEELNKLYTIKEQLSRELDGILEEWIHG